MRGPLFSDVRLELLSQDWRSISPHCDAGKWGPTGPGGDSLPSVTDILLLGRWTLSSWQGHPSSCWKTGFARACLPALYSSPQSATNVGSCTSLSKAKGSWGCQTCSSTGFISRYLVVIIKRNKWITYAPKI